MGVGQGRAIQAPAMVLPGPTIVQTVWKLSTTQVVALQMSAQALWFFRSQSFPTAHTQATENEWRLEGFL